MINQLSASPAEHIVDGHNPIYKSSPFTNMRLPNISIKVFENLFDHPAICASNYASQPLRWPLCP